MGPDGPTIMTQPGLSEVVYFGGRPVTIQAFNLVFAADRDRVAKINAAKRTWLRPLVYDELCYPQCRAAFARLPRARSLKDVWEDGRARIGFVSSTFARGATSNLGTIGLTLAGLDSSPRHIAATLLHELAHINGAEDAPQSTAEQILLHSGFADLYTPGI